MDALKWVIKVSMLIAFMFMGIKSAPKDKKKSDHSEVGYTVGYLYIR